MSPLYRRVSLRILPILFSCYLVNYIDRVNVSFAKHDLGAALKLSDAAYGLGAGLFFIGYFAFQVPSNLMLHRIGARRAIALIILLWGFISAAGALVHTEQQFYGQRLLLGASEAGFFPGVILYITSWYPAAIRARVFALFLTAIPVAGLIGGPLSGFILQNPPSAALQNWQWLFVLEGIPCLLLALWVFRNLPDRPADAPWLNEEERRRLTDDLQAEVNTPISGDTTPDSALKAFRHPLVWKLCLLYFCTMMGLYALSFWIPAIIKGLGWAGDLRVGLISAIPWSGAVVFMLWFGGRSDRHHERRRHASAAALLAAVGFTLCGLTSDGTLGVISISLAAAGVMGLMAVQWSMPGALLRGTAAAAGIALVNSCGNLGGFVSPYLIGALNDLTHATAGGLFLTGGFLLFAAVTLFYSPALEPNPN
ncbi:MAG: MFS transporter [Verrucomicrobiota bacterium]|jgi:MFS family permease